MKRIILFGIALCFSTGVFAQEEIRSAQIGVEYGAGVKTGTSVNVEELVLTLASDSIYTGRVAGKVIEVCKNKGCFMKIERAGDAEPIMVRFQDYGFFMPQDIVGKNVLLEGVAKVKETSIPQLKHFAEDAGKSESEIATITSPKTAIEITALGVKIVK